MTDAPKQIFRCDFKGCERQFVRQDLCARHRERHTKENSHLSRRDAFKDGKTKSSHIAEVQQELSPEALPTASTSSSENPRPQSVEQPANSKPNGPVLSFSSMALDPRLTTSSGPFNPAIPPIPFSGTVEDSQYDNMSHSASDSVASRLAAHLGHSNTIG
jgi:hypothetical protein